MYILVLLKFTPLEFETSLSFDDFLCLQLLKFTPLEFETHVLHRVKRAIKR